MKTTILLTLLTLCSLAASGENNKFVASSPTMAAAAQRAPIMGWSSWNTYHVNISDSLIMRQADALLSTGLHDVGYNYVNIDDGFFGHRDSTGTMVPHEGRFPRGVKCVADYIHSRGLKAGIYSDAGANTCGSRFDNDVNGFEAGLYGHEAQDAQLYFRQWGFDFIKIDFCGGFYDLSLDERARYTAIRKAIDAAGRNDVSINICRWAFPGTWAADLAASWRISSDIRPKWSSVKNIIRLNLPLSAYCRGGHYNDMDMLEMGRGLSATEEETHFGMWCIMASPLLIGCDLTTIRPASLALLKNKELIALNQDALHLQAHPVQYDGRTWVLVKDIVERGGLTRAVALYNPTDTVAHCAVALQTLDLSGKTRLRDLVHQKDMPTAKDSIRADIAPHGVIILKATAQRRLERSVYEAEQGYMPLYNALGKDKRTVAYVEREGASQGMAVAYLGGQKDNVLRWDDVWSNNGGRYTVTITYMPAAHRGLRMSVNGVDTPISGLKTKGGWTTVSVPVTLRKGQNTISLGNPYAWAMDIDKIELKAQ